MVADFAKCFKGGAFMIHCKSGIWLAVMGGLLFASAAFPAGDAVELLRKGDHVDVLIGGRLFTTYYFSSDACEAILSTPAKRARYNFDAGLSQR